MKKFHTGLLYQRLEAEATIRRNSPRGKAGQRGGWVAARTYPGPTRPRGAGGRFISNATPKVAGQKRAKAQTTEPSGAGDVANGRIVGQFADPKGATLPGSPSTSTPRNKRAGIPASTSTTPEREA